MKNSEKALKKLPKKWIINLIFTVALIALEIYTLEGSTINPLRVKQIPFIIAAFFRGFADILWPALFGFDGYQFNESIIYLALQTLSIGFFGTLLGAILAVPVAFLASRNIVGKHLAKVGSVLLVIIRVFPEIILAYILVKGLGIGSITGILVIGIHSVGMLGKLFAETIDEMDRSSIEALEAVGANRMQKVRYGILPQILPLMTSITLYRLDINVRSATVLGAIGAVGLGVLLTVFSDPPAWDILATIRVAIMAMVMIVDTVSSKLREKLI
ncbi:MAG: phosphonate ABC transporter, permease protein PhnE [Bacillota bacterium]|nr:phosphonate ABC transporter, permease protein PhnE [Bacillota bacterium]